MEYNDKPDCQYLLHCHQFEEGLSLIIKIQLYSVYIHIPYIHLTYPLRKYSRSRFRRCKKCSTIFCCAYKYLYSVSSTSFPHFKNTFKNKFYFVSVAWCVDVQNLGEGPVCLQWYSSFLTKSLTFLDVALAQWKDGAWMVDQRG